MSNLGRSVFRPLPKSFCDQVARLGPLNPARHALFNTFPMVGPRRARRKCFYSLSHELPATRLGLRVFTARATDDRNRVRPACGYEPLSWFQNPFVAR